VTLGYILTVIAAYLLGSIPTGFLVAKTRGIDIRTIGSGNIGATNVLRTLGKPAGILVLLTDALKGLVAVGLVAPWIANFVHAAPGTYARYWFPVCAGVAAILGHNYTCWLGFKGGKGIATSAGVLLAWVPWSLLIILSVWIVVFALTRYVSLASIAASGTLPFAAWLTHEPVSTITITAALAALAIYKHKSNITRLIQGTEHQFGKRPPTPQPPHPTE
jgi:glycerol-3-phosphate acyltransferase PlsY